ncbi:uncharacterized protein LOC109134709 [Beta vulgaris subsp. vulgaris]|uniref:uncharacterized protein LOC109134709 n=1 Tax=Beta vulgaris subsp. vulgaris TaxID=3555 RepID=UPI0025480A22|nr:uncharacterized protein LOC109134709 [Beta vulgaris subsp. vulgaris]
MNMKYFGGTRLGDSLGCDHSFEKWEICDMMFEGLNEETRKVVESMSNGDFHAQSLDEAWSLFEWLARDTYEWEMSMHANQNLENFSSYELETCISTPSSFHLDEFANVAHASYQMSSSPCMNSYDQSYAPNDESHMLDHEPIPPTIVDPLLQLEIDLKLLREKLGCNNDILEFNDVDSRNVRNENQLGKSSIELEDDFEVLMNNGDILEDDSLMEEVFPLKSCDVSEVVCENLVSIPSPHIPFARRIDIIPSSPILYPFTCIKTPNLDELLASFDLQVPNPFIIEEKSELATKKDFH